MHYNPEKHRRRSIRLKGFDYSQTGAYFVTVCTKNRECIFGHVIDGVMQLNGYGHAVKECWEQIPKHCTNATLDFFIIMPNHLHGIIGIVGNGRGMACHAPTNRHFGKPVPKSLSTIIGSFKSAVTKRINQFQNASSLSIWQRNYHEHIIRNQDELHRIREYIVNNPFQWQFDRENPVRTIHELPLQDIEEAIYGKSK